MSGVTAWERAGILFETYRYGPGPRAALPLHTHEHYQWCLSVDFPGYYDYRGARHAVLPEALSVIHPHEPHASADPPDRDRASVFLVANIPVSLVAAVTAEVGGRQGLAPFFRDVVTLDAEVRSRFLALHRASATEADRLAADAALLGLFERAVPAMASTSLGPGRSGPEPRAARRPASSCTTTRHARSRSPSSRTSRG
jgi:hypothetical protein